MSKPGTPPVVKVAFGCIAVCFALLFVWGFVQGVNMERIDKAEFEEAKAVELAKQALILARVQGDPAKVKPRWLPRNKARQRPDL